MSRTALVAGALVLSFAVPVSAQQPGWGTEPTQPGWGAQPTQPTQPTQPAWGTQPTQPAWGTQPTQPTEPSPAQPAYPPELPPTQPEPPDELANIGLGFSNHFGPLFVTSDALIAYPEGVEGGISGNVGDLAPVGSYANLSMRYRFNDTHEIEAILGMAYIAPTLKPEGGEEVEAGGFLLEIAPRYLLTIVSTERTRLYTGAGIGILFASASGDEPTADHGSTELSLFGFNFGVPLGIEYRFECAPNLGLTMEIGLALAYVSATTALKPATVPPGDPTIENDWSMFLFGLGQSIDTSDDFKLPIIDHLTLGLHYWFG